VRIHNKHLVIEAARSKARYTDEYKEQPLQLASQWSACRYGSG
jgi:hypothetical protein